MNAYIHQNIILDDLVNLAEGSILNKEEVAFINEYLAKHPEIKKLSRRRNPVLVMEAGEGGTVNRKHLNLRFSVIVTENGTPFLLYSGKERLGKVRALGSGFHARVKLGQNINTGEWVAIKVQKFKPDTPKNTLHKLQQKNPEMLKETFISIIEREKQKEKFVSQFKEEVQLEEQSLTGKGKLLRREYKIDKEEMEKEELKSYIVTKLGKGIDLAVFIGNYEKEHKQHLEFSKALHIAIASLEDLHRRFHNKQIIHKDLKAENMLFNPNTQHIRIIDLGMASYLGNPKDEHIEVVDGEFFYILDKKKDKGSLLGTIGFIAPEILKTNAFSVKSDIYAMGKMFSEQLHLTKFNLPSINSVVEKMLAENPFDRPNAMEVIHELKRIQTKILFANPVGTKKKLEAIRRHLYADPSDLMKKENRYLDPSLITARSEKENIVLQGKENVKPVQTLESHFDKDRDEKEYLDKHNEHPKISKAQLHAQYKHVHALHEAGRKKPIK